MSKKDLVLIIAGHYCVAPDYSALSNLAKTEIYSLMLGIEHYQYALQQGQQVKLVVWINDIGITPMEREQYQRSYQLPDNYADLLRQADISKNDIIIRFESRARNRASKVVRQLKRRYPDVIRESSAADSDLTRCVDSKTCLSKNTTQTILTMNDIKGLPLVVKEGSAAKCCTILALFLTELAQTFQPIKMVGIFNFLYVERIKTGIYVAQSLLDFSTPNSFLFCDETNVVGNEIFFNI